MPHELFDDLAPRRARGARYRRLLTILSIAVHVVIVSVVLIGHELVDLSPLPTPQRPLTFSELLPVTIEPIPMPRQAARAAASSPVERAPTIEPDDIKPDTHTDSAQLSRSDRDAPRGAEPGVSTFDPGVTVIGDFAPPPTPPAPPAPPQVIRLHAGMNAPVKIVHVPPIYPAIAQAARTQGVVILEAIIDEHGAVTSVRVLRSIPLLDDAAVAAVRQWRFTPALLNRQPVPVVMTVTVNFELNR